MIRHFSTNSRVVRDLFAQYQNTFNAFCELINNSIQARAKNVYINIDYVRADEVYHTAIKNITIKDDGYGVAVSELENKILKIGTNVKEGGRGIGRFAAIQIGSDIEIETVGFDAAANSYTKSIIPLRLSYFTDGKNIEDVAIETIEWQLDGRQDTYYKISINSIYDKSMWEEHPEVKLSKKFLKESIKQALFEHYPLIIFNQKTKFYINSEAIKPEEFISGKPETVIEQFRDKIGNDHIVNFNYIKLVPDLNQIKIFLTIENAGLQTVAGTFDYNADWLSPQIGTWFIYVSSDYFSIDMFRNLEFGELDENIKLLKQFIKETIDKFFRTKNKDFENFTKQLKGDQHYPFKEKQPSSTTKEIVFDKVAYLIEEKHHILRKKNELREIIYPLLDKAISNGEFKAIIESILKLDESVIRKFSDLLDRVELEDVINFSEKVSRKIQDLDLIERLIYGDISHHILERKQLHKILEHMLWIFGEEYSDSTNLLSDKNLGNNLEELRNQVLKFEPDDSQDNLIKIDNHEINSITDLFLFSQKIIDETNREVLIVELKAPKVKISPKELDQVKRYAYEIEERGIFPKRLKYKIFLLGAKFTKRTKNDIKGTEKTKRIPYFYWSNQLENVEIYVIEWSEIIENTKRKLRYMSSELKIKDISIKEKIIKDFSDIDFVQLQSRLKKSRGSEL